MHLVHVYNKLFRIPAVGKRVFALLPQTDIQNAKTLFYMATYIPDNSNCTKRTVQMPTE